MLLGMLQAPGFWGPPTSSVDWCETNYQVTRWVAELANTLSSLAMVGVGLYGAWLHRRTLERRFLLAFAALSCVGLGSVAFHATLRFGLQMLDELPMIYLALIIVYILLEDRAERRLGRWFPWLLALYACLLTLLSALTRGRLQFYAFQISFGSLELFALYRVYRLYRSSTDPAVWRLYRAGMAAYALAIACWFADFRFCSALVGRLSALGLPNPQLHAVWHVLVSCGFYCLILVIARTRQAVLAAALPRGKLDARAAALARE
jgi:dihydroceramidase